VEELFPAFHSGGGQLAGKKIPDVVAYQLRILLTAFESEQVRSLKI
jgi:hypothetical protein